MEIWDAYDENLNRIDGMTLVRGENVPEGVYHLVCDVLVRHADGDYLLMQRDPRKSLGGLWEASAGGAALKGETAFQSAFRELREETGILADELIEIGRDVRPETRAIYVAFLCVTDCDKASVTLQEGETCAFRWVSRDALLAMDATELLPKRMIRRMVEESL